MSKKKGFEGLRHELIKKYGSGKTMIPMADLKNQIEMRPNPEVVVMMDKINNMSDEELISEAHRWGIDTNKYFD